MSRLGLLRDHDFRQLFVADSFSQVGTQITLIALPLVAIVNLDVSNFQVGVLTACTTAAFVLVGLPAGAWVDRLRRRNVLIAGDIGRALLLASIPIAWWAGVLTIWQLYAVALLTGMLTVFFDVAYQSYLPHLVGRDNLVEGNAKLEIVRTASHMGGPALGGQVVQWLTAPFAIAVNAVTFAVSAVFVGFIRKREPRPERGPDAHLGREILEGLRFVLGNRLLRAIAACTGSFNLFFGIFTAMEVPFFVRHLGLSSGQIGLYFSIGAVGGLLGVVLVSPVVRWLGQGPTIWISTAVTAPFALLLPAAEPGWRTWLAAAGGIMISIGVVIYNVTQVSFRQGLTPERLLGRMNATMRFLVWGTMPVGGLLGGVFGQWFGARTALWIGAIGACLAFLPVFLSPLRTMRELPTRPDDEPSPDDGPSPDDTLAPATHG
uniref:MFS transporter n=1 Tax=Thermocrispum agreste TaxID=37925 RepID=A0A2W4KZF5_9PSEU|nr:MAG: MFS transporter [Thermocrispum agreste]